ncbi:MAG: FAD-dependent oxidoreductase [Sandaracinaceae bacterium]|nr:FAD-dependent oxidoreductase [Sandaracinaceae bacterium]
MGDVIPDEDDLVLVTPERFRERLAIDVRVRHEVLRIDREARTIEVRGPDGGVSVEPYDALVLCTGSRPIRPPVEGVDLPGVFTVRDVPDTRRLKRWIEERAARRAVVVGAGFIGLELAENLVHRGLEVTVIEARRSDPRAARSRDGASARGAPRGQRRAASHQRLPRRDRASLRRAPRARERRLRDRRRRRGARPRGAPRGDARARGRAGDRRDRRRGGRRGDAHRGSARVGRRRRGRGALRRDRAAGPGPLAGPASREGASRRTPSPAGAPASVACRGRPCAASSA